MDGGGDSDDGLGKGGGLGLDDMEVERRVGGGRWKQDAIDMRRRRIIDVII